MNIFEELRKEHEIQRKLLKKLVGTSGESPERKKTFEIVKQELTIHANAEERFLYVPMLKDHISQEKARHSIAEHHELDEMVETLDDDSFSSTSWLTIAKQLHHRVEHHLEEEEHEYFQIAGKVLTEKEKSSLASDYRKYIDKHRSLSS